MHRLLRTGWPLIGILLALNLGGLLLIRHEVLAAHASGVRLRAVLPADDLLRAEEISVLLDRPVAADDQLGRPLAHPPFQIDPRPEGHWRWAAPDRLVFELAHPLLPGRVYSVGPADDFEARTGWSWLGARRVRLSTGALELLDLRVRSRDVTHVTLALTFDQPVLPSELACAVDVYPDRAETPLHPQVLSRGASEELLLRVAAHDASMLRLVLAQGLAGDGAELGLRKPIERHLALPVGFVLISARARSSSQADRGTVRLYFSRPLDHGQEDPPITIEPPVEELETHFERRSLLLQGAFECRRRYRISVGESLLEEGGETLGGVVTTSIEIPPRPANLSIGADRGVLSPAGNLTLDVQAVNVGGIEVSTQRVHANNLVAHVRGERARATSRELGKLGFPLELAEDQIEELTLDLAQVLASAPGVYHLELRATEGRWVRDRALVRVTDLGMTARAERGGYRVWVNSIASTEPRAGVALEARSYNDQLLAVALTDERGFARLTVPPGHPDGEVYLISAADGEDLNFLRPDRHHWSHTGVDLGGRSVPEGLDVLLYPERDVLRPGESFHLTALARDRDGATPEEARLEVRMTRPDGREVAREELWVRAEEQGMGHLDLSTATTGQTGRHRIEVLHDGRVVGRSAVLVEAFVPARIELSATLPERVGPGEPLPLDLTGRYLHGGSPTGLTAIAWPTWRPSTYSSESWPDFRFRPVESPSQRMGEPVEALLDAEGRACLVFDVPEELPPGRWLLRAAASVTEPGARSVSAGAVATVDTTERHLGLASSTGRVVPVGEPAQLEWLLVDGENRLAGGAPLELELHRVHRESRLVDQGGHWSWRTEERLESIAELTLEAADTAQGRGRWAPTCPTPGSYRLLGKDSEDGVATRLDLFAVNDLQAWTGEPASPDEVELELDASSYLPGATARLVVTSPFPGRLLLSLEDDRVRWQELLQLEGTSVAVDVPLPVDLRGDAFLSASVVRPLEAQETDWLPHRAKGLARVRTESEAHRAQVEIEAPLRAVPGEPLEVRVLTDLAPGGRVHLWGVDEGILLAGRGDTPDPHAHFLAPRRRAVEVFDSYSELLPDHRRPTSLRRIGGDDDELARRREPVATERREPAVVWRESLPIGPDGELSLELVAPDLRGELRLMAVAVEGDRYGSAERAVTVGSPVFAQASLPRALAPGDRFEVPIQLVNTTDAAARVQIGLAVDGPLSVSALDEVIDLEPGESRRVWTAAEATGVGGATVELHLDVESRSGRSSRRTRYPLAVRRGAPLASAVVARRIEAGEEGELLLEGITAEAFRGRLSVAPHSELELEPALGHLLGYPHGCLEQTASRLAALLANPGSSGDGHRHEPLILAGIDRILSMQTRDGGLAYWSGGERAYPWGSAYAARLLLRARELGFELPGGLVDPLLDWLEAELRRKGEANLRALVCRTLAEADRPPTGWMTRLAERADELDVCGRAHLAAAWLAVGKRARAEELLSADGLLEQTAATQAEGRLTSTTRQRAVLLDVLLDLDPKRPEVEHLAGTLLASRSGGHWQNTLEDATVIGALSHLAVLRRGEGVGRGRVRLAGETIEVGPDAALERALDAPNPVVVENDGDGPLFALLVGEGRAAQEDARRYDRGLMVRRRWLDPRGEEIDPTALAVGDLVVVEIELSTAVKGTRAANVAVVDPLPGGLEVENPRLAISVPWIGRSQNGRAQRVEFLDDRVVLVADATDERRVFRYALRATAAGSFELPPVQASSMYDAAFASLAGGGRIEVAR